MTWLYTEGKDISLSNSSWIMVKQMLNHYILGYINIYPSKSMIQLINWTGTKLTPIFSSPNALDKPITKPVPTTLIAILKKNF